MWTVTFCCSPLQQEVKVERFRTSRTFLYTSPAGDHYDCRIHIKGNLLQYTCNNRYTVGE